MNSSIAKKQGEIARYENYLKADPKNPFLLSALGDLYHQAGQFDQAIECYQQALQYDQHNLATKGRLANVMLSQHRFADAEKLFTQLLQDDKEDPVFRHNLGLSLYYQKRWQDAFEAFQQAHSAGLQDPQNLAYIVYCLHHLTDTGQALQWAQQWLQLAPGTETEGYLAMLEMDHGHAKTAYERAENVLQKSPDNVDAKVVMGSFQIEQQQINKAIAYFEEVVQLEPDNPRGWHGLGLAYLYQQDFNKAIPTIEKALSFMPDNETTLLILGWAELANKNAVKAEKVFRQAISCDRNFGEAYGGLASALVFQNKQEEAQQAIKTSIRLDPQGFGAVFANSILLQLRGKPELGQKMLANLFEQAPTPDSKPLIEYIQVYAREQGAKTVNTKQLPRQHKETKT